MWQIRFDKFSIYMEHAKTAVRGTFEVCMRTNQQIIRGWFTLFVMRDRQVVLIFENSNVGHTETQIQVTTILHRFTNLCNYGLLQIENVFDTNN